MNKLKKIKDIDLKKMFLTEINDRIRKLQFQNNTNIKQSQGLKSAENKIKTKTQTISRIQAAEKEINKLEAEIMFCLIKNPSIYKGLQSSTNRYRF